jgi:hypothetical protein
MPHSMFKAAAVWWRAVLIVLVVTATLLIAEQVHGSPVAIETAVFESVSAFGTVGLSIGITRRSRSSQTLALISAMFMGRVGLFAMAIPHSRLSTSVIQWPQKLIFYCSGAVKKGWCGMRHVCICWACVHLRCPCWKRIAEVTDQILAVDDDPTRIEHVKEMVSTAFTMDLLDEDAFGACIP